MICLFSADESYHLPTTGNEACLKAAKAMSSTLQSPSPEARTFRDWLIKSLKNIVNKSYSESSKCLKWEKLWMDYYQVQVSEKEMDNLSRDLRSTGRASFFQSYTQILFDSVLKLKLPVPASSDTYIYFRSTTIIRGRECNTSR